MTPSFVHLHVHTQYSLLDGAIRIDRLLARASEFGMDTVAVTDHGTMFGTVEFYEKALEAGIKPIIGCECYLAPRSLSDKTPADSKGVAHLILLAQDAEGYRNLCRLCAIAQLEGFYYKPRIDREVLQRYSRGLIAMTACLHGEIPRLIQEEKFEQADTAAYWYQKTFGEGNFFLEVQNNGIPIQETVNQRLREMSQRLSIPLVASNDCHYLNKDDVHAHDVLLCIQTAKTVNDANRLKFRTDQLYFKSGTEMHADFQDYPGALTNTLDIARRCSLDFDFKTYHFPKFDSPGNGSPADLFEREARAGFERVLPRIRAKRPDMDPALYRERLDYEISIVKEMGFPGYFLIVADFIRYAKENGIPVGPGRGSAAGSLVAYALGITDLDPIAHGLIFERFLNPSRKSMPDIDVDFCINGREAVFKYVSEKYGGGEFVAQIITFGKLKTRAVIRDVGRALDIPLREVDAIAKMVPDVLNISLDAALKQEPRLREQAETNPQIADLIKICRVLEGLPRHASTHAAGVVIADKPLVEYLPLYRGKKGEVVTQFDMKCVEKIGLVKFDFLGLRNLTVIASTLELIARQGSTPPNLSDLEFNDPQTYALLGAGDTTGVFQLESSGMKDLLVRLKPECFEDIIALVALYRPGPMESGMIEDFVERKHGRKAVEYPLPELEPILNETYGVIVYQEQVMKIAGSLGNYSMAEADDLRKAMGKKISEIMAKHRQRFLRGAEENNIPADKASQLFDIMEKFGGYGFNKSHSAAYALIAYQTAYLKTHYPVEFIASLLSSEMHSTDGVVKFIAECRSHDIPVLPPDINSSDKAFTVADGKIRFGLLALKNVGEAAIESVLATRPSDGFGSLCEFCEQVDLKKVNKRVIESLIKSGAMDFLGARRAQMMAGLEDALDYGQTAQRERMDPQMGLFDTSEEHRLINLPVLPEIPEWDEKTLLANEKEALGFYVTGHPLGRFESLLDKFTSANSLSLKESSEGEALRIGGIVRSSKVIRTKKGEPMAFVTIEDLNGSVEVTVFSSLYAAVMDLLVEDNPVLIQGQVQRDDQACKLIADIIIPMDKAEEQWTASIHLKLDVDRTTASLLRELKELFGRHPGSCQAYLHLMDVNKSETVIGLPEDLKLKAGRVLARDVNGLCGYPVVQTICSVAEVVPRTAKFGGHLQRGGVQHA